MANSKGHTPIHIATRFVRFDNTVLLYNDCQELCPEALKPSSEEGEDGNVHGTWNMSCTWSGTCTIHVYMGVQLVCTWSVTCVCPCVHGAQHVYVHVYMERNMCMYMCTWSATCVCTCVHGAQHVYVHVYMERNMCMYMCTWSATCVCTCMCTWSATCVYTSYTYSSLALGPTLFHSALGSPENLSTVKFLLSQENCLPLLLHSCKDATGQSTKLKLPLDVATNLVVSESVSAPSCTCAHYNLCTCGQLF